MTNPLKLKRGYSQPLIASVGGIINPNVIQRGNCQPSFLLRREIFNPKSKSNSDLLSQEESSIRGRG